ncbi:hypothetical protein DFQ04_0551 [Algoriphagus boseongensis]|uniref:SnoaL-like protein n=1 Tax=Algoriphagus boseongensis TaxID=1442587 RepID=A0A4R6TAS5_9BACT|nr:nuclear transport factor 2 family protein [Algoriphagus boseongensis]TDQ18745.1 hypothetical protein DFQ04_0551 [Algoriphagus boseongensis]
MTRIHKIVIATFFIISFSLNAQGQSKSDEKQVHQLIQNMFDGLFSGFESAKIPEFMTEDFILLEDGMIWDNQIIKNYLDSQKAKPNIPTRVNRFEFIQTKISGDRAWVAYKNWATVTSNGQVIREAHWLESGTAIKTADGWKLEMLHSTPVEIEKL